MTVEVKEIVKQNVIDTAEDEMPSKNLQSSGISSEIDFLKRIKLRAQILSANVATGGKLSEDDIAAVTFESQEDKRKKMYYAKLIKLYDVSVGAEYTAAKRDATADELKRKMEAKMKIAYLYSIYGMKDLYSLACDLSGIEKTQERNNEIKGMSKSMFG
jgi:hypothetical protein